MQLPSGVSISVIRAATLRPFRQPISTINRASSTARGTVFMNAPVPTVTSSKMQSLPEASFLLMMLEAISGMLSTVAVTSRSAYIFRSAGAISLLCPTTAIPSRLT